MTLRLVNIGRADKGDGDPIRVAFDKINKNFQDYQLDLLNLNNSLSDLNDVVDSISVESGLSFDFGPITPRTVTTPIELLFYASQIDMGTIVSPTPVVYDAGNLG